MTPARFWPTDTQALLLAACLQRDPAAAVHSWTRWKARVDLDDLDHASFQTMSLVLHRLRKLGLSDPDLPRIKGLHRYQWTQHQLALRADRELLSVLHQDHIPTILLLGPSLAGTVYPEPSTRVLNDLNILIPPDFATRAMDLFRSRHWLSQPPATAPMIPDSHRCRLLHPEFGQTNLRWRLIGSVIAISPTVSGDDDFWHAARPFQYEQIPTQILCPADQFLLACSTPLDQSSANRLIWLLDCVFILRNSPEPFDWQRLLTQSNKFQLHLHLHATLQYLRGHFEPSIPQSVLAELSRTRSPLDQRIQYFLATRTAADPRSLSHKIGTAACRYINMKQGERAREFCRDVPRFFRWAFRRMRPPATPVRPMQHPGKEQVEG